MAITIGKYGAHTRPEHLPILGLLASKKWAVKSNITKTLVAYEPSIL